MERAKAPVFVVGSPRSGTTLLYHTILSSGNFVIYQAESDVFNRIAPAFGNLSSRANRAKLLDVWLQSDYFQRTGLKANDVSPLVLCQCRNAGDFLRIFMELMARKQGVERWADNTPTHVLHIPQIKTTIPDALFVHIIRDGRDVAMSMNRVGWGGYRLPWDRSHGLVVSGLYWEWLARKGRQYGRWLGPDYLEIRYEELVRSPRKVMKQLSSFIEHDLNYERIQQHAMGALKVPNSAYSDRSRRGGPDFVGSLNEIPGPDGSRLEALLAPFLRELGYPTRYSGSVDLTARRLRAFYPRYLELRLRLKSGPLSKFFVCRDPLSPGALNRALARWEAFAITDTPERDENNRPRSGE
jgi:hypothetical protein